MLDGDWFARTLSVAALSLSVYSVWLTRQRDRREQARSRPLFALTVDRLPGTRAWECTIEVTNRGADEIVVTAFEVLKPQGFRFVGGRRTDLLAPPVLDLDRRTQRRELNMSLRPGQRFADQTYVMAPDTWPAARSIALRVAVHMLHRGHDERSERTVITRTTAL